jgi:iron complex outermembrane receptor protein
MHHMNRHTNRFRTAVLGGAVALLSFSGPGSGLLYAQDPEAEAAANDMLEEIVVTGSRIARDEYTSAATLQTFDIESAKQIGITTVSELLQRSTIANGQQLNGELNTNSGNSNASEAPSIGGVGSANVSLRGLGPERTLILVNGRRLGSSGVRGAPAQPDINLLPLNMVERIEVITEGASSVYGADAVAGVVNVILRDDFEGMEFSVNTEFPTDGGDVNQVSFMAGANSERSRIVVAGEYYDRERLRAGDRYDCPRNTEVDQQGNVTSQCFNGFFDNSVYVLGGAGTSGQPFAWWTPGTSDLGVMNWSNASSAAPDPVAPNASERADDRDRVFFLPEYSDWDERLDSDLVAPMERFSIVALGAYETDLFSGSDELYFEAYYLNRRLLSKATHEQIFPTVRAMIPQEDANGNIIVDSTGAPVLVDNPLNPFGADAIPIVTLDDIPQHRNVELQHFRFVGGFRGEFGGSNWFADHNFAWDVSMSYDRGTGFQSQTVLNEANLSLSLDTLRFDADGNLICGVSTSDVFGFVTPDNCVPVKMFASSIYNTGAAGEGRFSSDAEREFLLGTRVNRTVVSQTLFSAYITGDLFEIDSGGMVGFASGIEFREDKIDSAADFLGSSGGVAAENPLTEGETRGFRDLFEVYAEVNVPLIVGRPGVEYFGFEAAARYTDESNFGSETTERFRVTYKPNDWITASASYGTSFRAPNLREQFLANQFSGVGGDSDPCAIPDAANVGGVYDASQDTRSQTVLDNCVQSGADPTILGLTASTTIPVTIGGNSRDLIAETSDSFTATLQFSPDVGENWDFDFAISYFDIEIEDTVRSIAATTIMTRCYEDAPNLSSPFCSRLERGGAATDPAFNFITAVDASFVNIGLETAQGYDFNTRLMTNIGGWQAAWTNALTIQTERDEQIFSEDPVEDLLEDFGVPEYRWTSVLSLARENWEFVWNLRYLSETHASRVASIDAECDSFDDATSIAGTTPTASVCTADEAFYNDLAATYYADNWTVSVGVNNVFDEEPPIVDMGAGSNRLGRVTSSGYDQFGRTLFLNATTSL